MLRAAKNKVNGYTQAQILVRDCTRNNDTADVPIMELRQLVEYSYNQLEIVPMFEMLDKRLNDKGKYWKHILKALIVLEFLVINGSEMCVTWCKENIYLIKTLREFMWRNPVTDFDHGSKIRLKAKELTSLLLDDARLKRERDMAAGNRNRNKSKKSHYDDDLQRALDESMRTAREEEERRRNVQQDQEDLDVALQLSKEEEELKRLQELQRLRQLQLQQQQLQQQNMMYDVNGNPISPEEYQQFLQQQQQQQQMQYQQYLQQLQQQQQMLLQQQQYEMYQQQLRDQEEANKQNILQQYATSSNPFKKEPEPPKPETVAPQSVPQPEPEQPLKRTRTGDAAISAKYSELNNLLMTGPGIDTFGNTGASRIPAHHTKTGTFINSQGTGYYQQQSAATKNQASGNNATANPFLKDQYTGLFSTIKEQKTGFGFGNAPSMNTSQGNNEQSLIDL